MIFIFVLRCYRTTVELDIVFVNNDVNCLLDFDQVLVLSDLYQML